MHELQEIRIKNKLREIVLRNMDKYEIVEDVGPNVITGDIELARNKQKMLKDIVLEVFDEIEKLLSK